MGHAKLDAPQTIGEAVTGERYTVRLNNFVEKKREKKKKETLCLTWVSTNILTTVECTECSWSSK